MAHFDGLDKVNKRDVTIFMAGTKQGASMETSGGRVMSICAVASHLEHAVTKALRAASLIKFKNAPEEFRASYRGDIGFRAILHNVRKSMEGLTYKNSGVNVEKADTLVSRIKEWARVSRRPGVRGDLGLFGAIYDIDVEKFEEPLLVSGTDGVGTKLKIAQAFHNHKTIGEDLVAMCVNDILMHGAEPLFFLDYLAIGYLEENLVSEILKGIAKGCTIARCSLIGGETAELPGVYGVGEYDLAGFAVGAVNKKNLMPKCEEMVTGDVLIGISSSGLHSNGYSLIRKVVENLELDYMQLAPFSHNKTLGEVLMTPTFIYTSLVKIFSKGLILGAAHITGGGLEGNIMRIIPDHLAVQIDQIWSIPSVFAWLTGLGISTNEMLKTFNLGIGVVVVVRRNELKEVMRCLDTCFSDTKTEFPAEYLPIDGDVKPYTAWQIGSLVDAEENEARFRIKGIDQALMERASILTHLFPNCFRFVPKKRVAVLISGSGTNLQALLNHTMSGASQAQIVLVISNKEEAYGLQRAQNANVPTKVIRHKDFSSREDFEYCVDRALVDFDVDLVVLAGFMRILTGSFVRKWRGKMINIHPSLLPSFKGNRAVKQALDAGVTVTGCTAHFVEEEVDGGAIIAQESVPVLPTDSVESLAQRLHPVEHLVLPRALELVARGKVSLNEDGTCTKK